MNEPTATSLSGSLSEVLVRAAAEHPDRPAVVEGDRVINYSDLRSAVSELAEVLARHGVAPGDRVAVLQPKSIDAVISLYAVLEAGACYVPLDVDSPLERLVQIAGDCTVSCLVASDKSIESGSELERRTGLGAGIVVIREGAGHSVAPVRRSRARRDPQVFVPVDDRPAYILYTSGSTGRPKGVTLTHGNALAFVSWAAAAFDVTPEDRLSSHAPFHFDLSIFDLYVAAFAGASVHLVPRSAMVIPRTLAAFIESAAITIWYSVPSALSMLVQRGGLHEGRLPSLRWLLFAGEVFPTPVVRELQGLLPAARLANLYGPTETNVCTWYEVGELDNDDSLPIGTAIDGVEVVIVGEDGRRVAAGEVGEVVVCGPTVMRGYWNDPERTNQVLVPHPEDHQRVVYRTGDLARARSDGLLDFIGRRDDQVKCRGYRVELGEVEASLQTHPGVLECAVVPIPQGSGGNGLHAFVVLTEDEVTAEVARHCRARLPGYMVPGSWSVLDELPRTSTGKLDRVALRKAHRSDASVRS